MTHPGPVNLAFGSRVSLLDLIAELESILGRPLDRRHTEPAAPATCGTPRPTPPASVTCFPIPSRSRLGEGLRATVTWFQEDALSTGLTDPAPTGSDARAGDRRVLTAGAVLVGVSVAAAAAIAVHSGPNPVDHGGFSLIPKNPDSSVLIWVSKLGRPLILVLGTLAAALVAVRRDRTRALACLGGPFLANLLVEMAFKPLVGRRFEGVLSFPSGNVTDVAAVATAWVLAVPRRGRPLVALVGAVATGGMVAAVIGLRWHYPTDALVGAAFGVGMVLTVDGALHLPDVNRRLPARLRSDRDPAPPEGAPREDSGRTAPHQK